MSVKFICVIRDRKTMLMAILEPPQSLLAKQRNLSPTASTDPTNEQNAAPVEDADKEVLVVRRRRRPSRLEENMANSVHRKEFTTRVLKHHHRSPHRLNMNSNRGLPPKVPTTKHE